MKTKQQTQQGRNRKQKVLTAAELKTKVMLSADEAYLLAGGSKSISRGSWYNALKSGQIPSVRIGKRYLVPTKTFLRFLHGGGLGVQAA